MSASRSADTLAQNAFIVHSHRIKKSGSTRVGPWGELPVIAGTIKALVRDIRRGCRPAPSSESSNLGLFLFPLERVLPKSQLCRKLSQARHSQRLSIRGGCGPSVSLPPTRLMAWFIAQRSLTPTKRGVRHPQSVHGGDGRPRAHLRLKSSSGGLRPGGIKRRRTSTPSNAREPRAAATSLSRCRAVRPRIPVAPARGKSAFDP